MKKLLQSTLLSISMFAISNQIFAQGNPNASNGFEITNIVSPAKNLNYNLNDSSDFIIQVRNTGPNSIIAGDLFKINYSIYGADGKNNQSFDTSIYVGSPMPVGTIIQYTLRKNVALDTANNSYIACADISGTALYPINSNKFPDKCSPFTVRIEEQIIALDKLFYAEGILYFDLSSNKNITAEVFDITGKSLKKATLFSGKKQQIPFNAPSNGFYFMKVYSQSTATATVKFVVNQ